MNKIRTVFLCFNSQYGMRSSTNTLAQQSISWLASRNHFVVGANVAFGFLWAFYQHLSISIWWYSYEFHVWRFFFTRFSLSCQFWWLLIFRCPFRSIHAICTMFTLHCHFPVPSKISFKFHIHRKLRSTHIHNHTHALIPNIYIFIIWK